MSAIRTIFFDLDGTLVDSRLSVLNSLRAAIQAAGLTYSEDRLSSDVIGPPIDEIFRNILPAVTHSALVECVTAFRRIYDAHPETGLEVYDGMEEMLSRLREQGIGLRVVTNKPIRPTRKILEFLGWTLFQSVETPDSGATTRKRSKAESISALLDSAGLLPEQTLMAGDTLGDIRAAHAAGIPAVAVLWGYEKEKNTLIAEADFSVSSPQELLSLLSTDWRA